MGDGMVFDGSDGPRPADVPGLPAVLPQAGPGSRSGWHYTDALGELIAELYGDAVAAAGAAPDAPQDNVATRGLAGGLWGLHYALPDTIPPPAVVHAWRTQYPGFGLLMRAAEKLRAESFMEQAIAIADHDPAPAPRVALRIATRQRMAEKLDRARWGDGATSSADALGTLSRQGAQPLALEASDD